MALTGLWYPLLNYFPSLRGQVEVLSPEPMLALDSTWLSPDAAFRAARSSAQETGRPHPLGAHGIRLYNVGGRPVYEVETDGRTYWIRADEGTALDLDAEEAQRIVEQRYGLQPGSLTGSVAERRSWEYWGDVGFPAFVFRHPEQRGTIYAVQSRNGQVATATQRSRISMFLMRAHTFWPVGEFSHREVERGILVLSGLLTLALGITGYFLLFPLRFRKRNRS